MKFGGSGTNYFVYSGIATALVMDLIARRPAGRRAFMETYRLEKVPVVLCTVMAQVVMVSLMGKGGLLSKGAGLWFFCSPKELAAKSSALN